MRVNYRKVSARVRPSSRRSVRGAGSVDRLDLLSRVVRRVYSASWSGKVVKHLSDVAAAQAPQRLAFRIIHGKLNPRSKMSEVAALRTAVQLWTGASFSWPPVITLELKRLSTEASVLPPRQALPLPPKTMARIALNESIPVAVRTVIFSCWLTGSRVADIFRVAPSDVTEFSSAFRLRVRGAKKAGMGSRSFWRWLQKRLLPPEMVSFWRTSVPQKSTSPKMILRFLRKAGPFGKHSIRRGVATAAAAAGVRMRHIRDLLGHAQIRTTRVYVEPTPQQREALDIMQAAAAASKGFRRWSH